MRTSRNPYLVALGLAREPRAQRALNGTKPPLRAVKSDNRARAKAGRASRKKNR